MLQSLKTNARLLAKEKPIVLTDQFAPVDQLMAEVFRRRWDR